MRAGLGMGRFYRGWVGGSAGRRRAQSGSKVATISYIPRVECGDLECATQVERPLRRLRRLLSSTGLTFLDLPNSLEHMFEPWENVVMTSSTDTLASAFARLGDLSVAFAVPAVTGLSDDEVLASQRIVAEIRRRADATAAVLAAEVAHRSRRELGYTGLATRLGARTPELLVARVAGTSAREAGVLVRVGALTAEPR